MRPSPKQERLRRQKVRATAAIIGVATVFLTMATLFFIAEKDRVPLDAETLCPLDGGPETYWAVLLDVTDEYDALQRTAVRNEFERIKTEVPKHGLLAVHLIGANQETALRPVLELCNPGTGDDISIVTGNPELARRRWQEQFEAPLATALDTMLSGPALAASPIMEALQSVSVYARKYDVDRRNMVVFSDLLQHTTNYSHYSGTPPDFLVFNETSEYSTVQSNLNDWKIFVHYIWRDHSSVRGVQGRSHVDFWDQYISSLGGELIRVKRLN